MATTDKARHAFGMLENIDSAIADGKIDAYDILFVKDADGNPYVGWIDKDGQKVILQDKVQIVRVEELPTENGDENVVYVHNNTGYIWDSTNNQCVNLCKPTDVTELQTQLSELCEQMEQKVDIETVQGMIEEYSEVYNEIIEF